MGDRIIKNITIGTISLFVILFVYELFFSSTKELLFDRAFSIAVILFLYSIRNRFRITPFIFGFNVSSLLLHGAKLYPYTFIGISFDKIMHFYAALGISLLIFSYLSQYQKGKNGIRSFELIFISFIAAFGISSLVEVLEFVGYGLVGAGEGLLGYGIGDFGEWNNTAWDLISNGLGALLGSILMYCKNKFK